MTEALNTQALNAGASATCQPASALNTGALGAAPINGGGCAQSQPAAPAYTLGAAFTWLALRTVATGSATQPLWLRSYVLGQAALAIPTALSAATGAAVARLSAAIYSRAQSGVGLLLSAGSTIAIGQAASGITVRIGAQGSTASGLLLRLATAPDYAAPNASAGWRPIVRVNGVAIATTGSISVTAEESSARVAQFSVVGAPVFSLDSLVSIEVVSMAPSGSRQVEPIFTGRITEPAFDPARRVSTYTATDQLQRLFDGLSRAQIEAITPNATTSQNNADEGFAYLTHRLDSATMAVDLDRFGKINTTPWDGAVPLSTPIAAALDGSERLSLIRADTLTNQIGLSLSISWLRLGKAQWTAEWVCPFSQCQYLGYNMAYKFGLPTAAAIESAVANSGWQLDQANYDSLFVAGRSTTTCNSQPVILFGDFSATLRYAVLSLSRRYSRSMNLSLGITLSAASSASAFGLHAATQQVGYRDAGSDAGWSDGKLSAPLAQDPSGDGVHDLLDAATLGAVYQDAIARARHRIIQSHRATQVSASVPLRPDIERYHRVTLDLPFISASGKVVAVNHRLDTDSGSATTDITIALFQGGSGNPIGPLPSLPPLALTSIASRNPTAQRTTLGTYIGATQNSPAESDEWSGWITNGSPTYPGAPIYKTDGFALTPPDITFPDQSIPVKTITQALAIDWPNDPLTYH